MSKKIFILEDDPIMIKLYRSILKNFDITHSNTVHKAIDICKNDKFDLYIVDILILGSDLSGEDLINLGIDPVLVITGYKLNEIGNYNNINYIRKPVKPSVLLTVINKILYDN